LTAGESGWNLQAGGRLGRHPRLAQDVTRAAGLEEVAGRAATLLALRRQEGRPHERLGHLLDRLAEEGRPAR
jgi:NAD(P)H-nitrite reductase large subunit